MSISAANCRVMYREVCHNREQQQPSWSGGGGSCLLLLQRTSVGCSWFDCRNRDYSSKKISKRELRAEAFWPDMTRPTSVEMESISDSDQLDQILLQARELSQPIIIDWMASWCRKCIYLKPKLEKLAAEYDSKIKFYCVDVNKVPQTLVKRGNVSKMPTIQLWKDGEVKAEVIGGHKAWLVVEELWKDGEMRAEVIGGHKAWLVVEEVREMIKKFI